MVPPEEIEKAQPATLPADFSEWDSGDTPTPEAAKPATVRVAVSPVVDRLPKTGSYIPTPVNADVEKLFQPHQSDRLNEEVEKHKAESKGKHKGMVAFATVGSLAVLLALGSVGYFKLRPKTVMPKQPVVQQPTTPVTNTPLPAVTNAPATAPVPAVSGQDRSLRAQSEIMNSQLAAPSRIPNDLKMLAGKEPPPSSGFTSAGMEGLGGNSGGGVGNVFGGRGGPSVKVEAPKKMSISAGVAGGLLIQKTAPVYPQIAKEARVSGTVVIQATISKTGMIENPRVVNGPAMLRQPAVDAVKSWRYRPYLLDGEPVEVETTVSVTFTLGG